jgi:hypothetical protein
LCDSSTMCIRRNCPTKSFSPLRWTCFAHYARRSSSVSFPCSDLAGGRSCKLTHVQPRSLPIPIWYRKSYLVQMRNDPLIWRRILSNPTLARLVQVLGPRMPILTKVELRLRAHQLARSGFLHTLSCASAEDYGPATGARASFETTTKCLYRTMPECSVRKRMCPSSVSAEF